MNTNRHESLIGSITMMMMMMIRAKIREVGRETERNKSDAASIYVRSIIVECAEICRTTLAAGRHVEWKCVINVTKPSSQETHYNP